MELHNASRYPLLKYAALGTSLTLGMALKTPLLTVYHKVAGTHKAPMPAQRTAQPQAQQNTYDKVLQQANDHYAKGNNKQATTLYRKALNDHPHLITTLLRLGNSSIALQQFEQARIYYQGILAINPQNPAALICLGISLQNLKRPQEAVNTYKKATKLYPTHYDAHLQLSNALGDLERYDEALESARQAQKLKPNSADPYVQLGFMYNKKGDLDAATDAYKKALKYEHNNATALQGIGYTYRTLGKMKEAIPYLERAIAANPNYVDAHISLAFANWALGNLPKAWEEYEWRWQIHGMNPSNLNIPLWDGSDLTGKSIMVYCEQGMGDTLQFIRYAKLIKERGAKKVICKVQKPLLKLLASCEFVDELLAEGTDVTADYQAPLLSLPRIFNTTMASVPVHIPYIQSDQKLTNKWKTIVKPGIQVGGGQGIRAGLCWHVDPVHEEIKSPFSKRAMKLTHFASLGSVPGVQFYSLQKDTNMEEVKSLASQLKVNTFGPDFDKTHGSFMDTAAVIENLDVVITVDTAVAHVAGALGKRVWMILPYSPDPRWHKDRNDSPWYPSMKLFRQTKPFDWSDVMAEVKSELVQLTQKGHVQA